MTLFRRFTAHASGWGVTNQCDISIENTFAILFQPFAFTFEYEIVACKSNDFWYITRNAGTHTQASFPHLCILIPVAIGIILWHEESHKTL